MNRKDLFFEYFRGRKDAYAIKIKNLTLYPKQIDPKEIMFTYPVENHALLCRVF